jgi:hypothetical protein
MRPQRSQLSSATAILLLAEIKASIDAFNRGDMNVADALDAIIFAIESHQVAANAEVCRDAA